MTHDPTTTDWNGPHGWKGRAIPGYRDFPFHELPWTRLRREGSDDDGVRCVKSSNSRRVFRIVLPAATGEPGRVLYAKRYRINTLRRRVGTRLLGNKAAREFDLGHGLLHAGIPTPLPLAWAEHRSAVPGPADDGHERLPPAAYLLTLEWPNAGSVADWLIADPAQRPRLISPLAAFLATSHERGFYHDDCAADHILIAATARFDGAAPPDDPFGFIDLDNGRLSSQPVPTPLRLSNLFQVLRSLSPDQLPAQDRIALLQAYRKFWTVPDAPAVDECVRRIEQLAFRKVGRKVVNP
jgi:hypothetical protein